MNPITWQEVVFDLVIFPALWAICFYLFLKYKSKQARMSKRWVKDQKRRQYEDRY